METMTINSSFADGGPGDMNWFQGTHLRPYHLSVGAVVVDVHGKVACQHVARFGRYRDLYLLMRETVEMGERLEEALTRGLREEMGLGVEISAYLGSLVSHFPRGRANVEKTTLYFLCRFVGLDPRGRDESDPDSGNEIEWHRIEWLIHRSHAQGQRWSRTDFDESLVLSRAHELLQSDTHLPILPRRYS
jgi:ADP-ribose pyrophosphatase YjhB (NUDIX family)